MKWKVFVIVLFLCIHAFTQNIPLKGNLGVGIAPAPPNEYDGIYAIAEITPNSTAENLGMIPKDILLEVNGEKLDSNQKIESAISKFIAGNTATVTVLRNGKKVTLQGKIMAKPTYKKPNHELELLELPFREGYVRAYLTHPKGLGPFPTIYFIQGYSCQSINVHPQGPTLQLTNALVDLGYAVFRLEKPGVGEYVDLKPCREYSYDDELENFINGLHYLPKHKLVDENQIYLFGHSLGGNVAPLLANDAPIAGVMVYGTMVKPWQDYLLDMALYSQTYSMGANAVMSKLPILKSSIQKLYTEDLPHTELNEEERILLENWHDYTSEGYVFTRKIDFWKAFSKYNYLKEWSKVEAPVLAMYGESDAHAISSLDAELIAHTINEKYPGKATFKLIKGTNHLFAKVPSRTKELEYINSGMATQIAFTQFNPELPKLMDSWIRSQINKDKNQQFHISSLLDQKSNTDMSSMDVVAEDFNGDGKKDIVLATEFGPNRILIYEDGKWVEQTKMPSLKQYTPPFQGEDSEDIAVADFDKDGDLDLFFVSEDTESHELLFNNGLGKFTFTEFQIPKKGQANAVLVHDFNNDGWQDILIGIRGQNELYINQDGNSFRADNNTYWPQNEDHTQDLIAVDIDNDNDLDIVEGVEKGGNNLYINQNGQFTEALGKLPLSEEMETRKVVANDFDKDGDMDLFYCNVGWNPQKDPQNQLLENDGKGNFTNITQMIPNDSATTLDASFLDINGDGYLDFVTTNFINDEKVSVFLANPNGDKLIFEKNNELFPVINFMGGVSVLHFQVEEEDFLYFSNFKSKDVLLQRR